MIYTFVQYLDIFKSDSIILSLDLPSYPIQEV